MRSQLVVDDGLALPAQMDGPRHARPPRTNDERVGHRPRCGGKRISSRPTITSSAFTSRSRNHCPTDQRLWFFALADPPVEHDVAVVLVDRRARVDQVVTVPEDGGPVPARSGCPAAACRCSGAVIRVDARVDQFQSDEEDEGEATRRSRSCCGSCDGLGGGIPVGKRIPRNAIGMVGRRHRSTGR